MKIRYTNESGQIIESHPKHWTYSTVIMCATEYFDEDTQTWKSLPVGSSDKYEDYDA